MAEGKTQFGSRLTDAPMKARVRPTNGRGHCHPSSIPFAIYKSENTYDTSGNF